MRKNESESCGKLSLALCLALASLTMGCATSTPRSVAYQPPAPPADLAAPCQALQPIADGQAVTVAAWIVDTVGAYNDCSARQQGLVRAWPGVSFGGSIPPQSRQHQTSY